MNEENEMGFKKRISDCVDIETLRKLKKFVELVSIMRNYQKDFQQKGEKSAFFRKINAEQIVDITLQNLLREIEKIA